MSFWSAREFRFLAWPGKVGAHLLVLLGLSMEWVDLCHVRGFEPGALWFGLTILLVTYGTALLVRSKTLRLFALALVAAAAAKFLLLDLPFVHERATGLLLQMRFAAGAAAAAACLFAATRGWPTYLRLLGHVVLVATLTGEVLDLFARQGWDHGGFAAAGLWATYGLGALEVGYSRQRRHLRGFGLVLLWVALVLGLMLVPAGGRAAHLLLNARCLGLGVTAAGLLLSAGFYRRRVPPDPPLRWSNFVEDKRLGVPLSLAGHGLVMFLLTLEAADRFHLAGSEEHMRQLSYSLIWAVYAIGMVIAGLQRRYRPVRLMALGVLAATIAKVFFFDLSFLTGAYRILSFLALGAILVAVSFLYQKYRQVLV